MTTKLFAILLFIAAFGMSNGKLLHCFHSTGYALFSDPCEAADEACIVTLTWEKDAPSETLNVQQGCGRCSPSWSSEAENVTDTEVMEPSQFRCFQCHTHLCNEYPPRTLEQILGGLWTLVRHKPHLQHTLRRFIGETRVLSRYLPEILEALLRACSDTIAKLFARQAAFNQLFEAPRAVFWDLVAKKVLAELVSNKCAKLRDWLALAPGESEEEIGAMIKKAVMELDKEEKH